MKCFLPCFGSSKRSKQSRSVNAIPKQGGQAHVAEAASQLIHQNAVAESKVRFEEQSNGSGADKVTSTKELIESLEGSKEEQEKATKEEETNQRAETETNNHGEDEGNERLLQEEEEWSESLFSLSIESRKQVSAAEKADTEVNSPMQLPGAEKEESKGNGVESPKKEANEQNTIQEESSVKKKLEGIKGPEYRYRDCLDEGYDGMNLSESNVDVTLEDDDDDEKRGEEGSDGNVRTWIQEESSESLFSLCTDYSRRPTISAAEKADNEVDSAHVTDDDVSSVLNPIENVTQTQGRVAKTTATLKKKMKNDKENINSDSALAVVQDDADVDVGISLSPEHRSSKLLSKRRARQKMMHDDDKGQEIRVDTSLSSWLEATTTPVSMKSNSSVGEQTPNGGRGSPWSNEDRPILGALTVEEIRMYSHSASTCSRRSRSKSPDDTPIIGTVGSYWTHTGQIIESNSAKTEKNAKVKSSSATLKTRLETAFEASVCEV